MSMSRLLSHRGLHIWSRRINPWCQAESFHQAYPVPVQPPLGCSQKPLHHELACDVHLMRSIKYSRLHTSSISQKELAFKGEEIQIDSISSLPESELDRITLEEEMIAINVLNNADANVLEEFRHISPRLAELIVEFRVKHGQIQYLTDLLQIPGVAELKLSKIVNAIANNMKKEFIGAKPSDVLLDSRIISPKLRLAQVPESVVACCIQPNAVSWAHLSRELELCDWQVIWLMEEFHIKNSHSFYQDKLWEISCQIPGGDVYLMEELPLRLNSSKGIPRVATRWYMDSALTTLFNHRNAQSQKFEHHVYKLKNTEVGRYFDLLVGSEVVGCQDTVSNIFKGICEPASGVFVPEALVRQYYRKGLAGRELLGQCLLQSVAFYKFLAQRNPHVEQTESNLSPHYHEISS